MYTAPKMDGSKLHNQSVQCVGKGSGDRMPMRLSGGVKKNPTALLPKHSQPNYAMYFLSGEGPIRPGAGKFKIISTGIIGG